MIEKRIFRFSVMRRPIKIIICFLKRKHLCGKILKSLLLLKKYAQIYFMLVMLSSNSLKIWNCLTELIIAYNPS